MNKFNIHNTNTKIKTHILSDEIMRDSGFDMDKFGCSWLMVKPLTRDIELWFEVWGEEENDFQIEVNKTCDIRPYMSNLVRDKFEEEMVRLQNIGIISGYDVGDAVFKCGRRRNRGV